MTNPPSEPPPPTVDEPLVADTLPVRIAAAEAMRRLNHAMVAHETDPELLQRIAREANATAAIVEAGARRQRPSRQMKTQLWQTTPEEGQRLAHFEECMVSGRANPMGIAMQPRRQGDRIVADVNFGAAFEGAPKRAHGGAVAAVMDDIMGYVLLLTATPAFTGRLSISYRSPTPVQTDLVASAWMDRRDGRKVFLVGDLRTAEGDLIAEADALFVAIPRERLT